MLNETGFDAWAKNYDQTVKHNSETQSYPFAGYTAVLDAIYCAIPSDTTVRILDIGFGTAKLTSRLYADGHSISGIDFSAEMLAIAQGSMPKAALYQHDFTEGLPDAIQNGRFSYIISTYAFHHIPPEKKTAFILSLLSLLESDGCLLIGDVSFPDEAALERCKQQFADVWDDEYYMVYSALMQTLADKAQITFHQLSFCAGVFVIKNKE